MAGIVYRVIKGQALTWLEEDNNFRYLNTKIDAAIASIPSIPAVIPTTMGGTGINQTLSNNNRIIITSSGTMIPHAAITANRAIVSSSVGLPVASSTTADQIAFLNTTTSDVQVQIDTKYTIPTGTTAEYIRGDGSVATFPTGLPPGGSAGGDLTGTYPNPLIGTNKVTYAKFQQVAARSIVGNPTATALANAQTITAGTDFNILRRSGTTIAFGSINLAESGAVGSSILLPVNGGTGIGLYAVGDILYASTTTTLSRLADIATGNALLSGGVGVAPSWGKVNLTTTVTGVLPYANGGTNANTSWTQGSVIFAGASSFSESTGLTWNNTNTTLSITGGIYPGLIVTKDSPGSAYFEGYIGSDLSVSIGNQGQIGLGVIGTYSGQIFLGGSSSGTVTLSASSSAITDHVIYLPVAAASANGYALTSLTSGVTSWSLIANGVITGYSSTTGTVSATDTIVQAISKLNGNTAAIAAGYVTSITGTANQVIASAATGAVTLSLPQSIATTSTPTFSDLSLGANASHSGRLFLLGSTSGTATISVSATASNVSINTGLAVNSELIYSTTSKGLSLITAPGAGSSTGLTIQNTTNNANSVAVIQLLNANNSQDIRFQAFGQGSTDNGYVGSVTNTGFDIYTNGLKSLIISNAGEMVARAGLSLYTNAWVMSDNATYNFVEQTTSTSTYTENLIGNNVTTGYAKSLLYASAANTYLQHFAFGSAYPTSGLALANTVLTQVGTTYNISLVNSSAYTIYHGTTARFSLAATTGAATFHSGSVTTGITGSQTGSVTFAGGTSGAAVLTAAAAAGTPTITLPTTNGTLMLASGSIPASQITAGTFGAGAYTFPSSLAITGAFSGATTGAFSSTISSTAANNIRVLHATGATTGLSYMDIQNTSGRFQFGLDNSTGGGLAVGSSAYSTVLVNTGATDLHLATNSIVRLTIDSTGKIIPVLQVGNAGLSAGMLYKDTAANILANSDYVVGMKA